MRKQNHTSGNGKRHLGVIWQKLWEQLHLSPAQHCWSERQAWKLKVDTSNANIMNVCARNANSYAPHFQKLLLQNCILSKTVTALPFWELDTKYTPRGNFLKIENKHIHQGWFFFGSHFGTLRLSVHCSGGEWKISTSFRKSKTLKLEGHLVQLSNQESIYWQVPSSCGLVKKTTCLFKWTTCVLRETYVGEILLPNPPALTETPWTQLLLLSARTELSSQPVQIKEQSPL